MKTRTRRSLTIRAGAVAGAAALMMGGAFAAHAHVGIVEETAEAGAYEVLTVSVPHGCDGSATTEVAIQIPDGINAVTPTRNPLYTTERVMETLEPAMTDSHGNEVTERVEQVVYSADTPLPEGQRDTFELSLQVPEEAAESTLYFPTVQTCEQGEAAWVQIPSDGQDVDELDAPAPSVAVVAPGENSADGTGTQSVADAASTEAGVPAASGRGPLVITSLAVGGLGLLVAVVALMRGRRQA